MPELKERSRSTLFSGARELSDEIKNLKFKAQRADSKLEHGIAVQKSMINQIASSKLRRPVRNEK